MKKHPSAKTPVCVLMCMVLFFGFIPALYAQGAETEGDYYSDGYAEDSDAAAGGTASDTAVSDGKLFLTFNEGLAASWLTRIINKTERSNFVFEDFLVGLYFNMDLNNVKYVTPMLRLAAYYPLTSTFNKMPQQPNVPLHFGADMLVGAKFQVLDVKYASVNLGAALHLFFLNAERWNYLDLGGAALLGIEVPLTPGWTLLIGGNASLDSGNLGTNRLMEPFDVTWQYQVDLGVRFSKKKQNATPIFSNVPEFSFSSLFGGKGKKSNDKNSKPDQTDFYDDNESPPSENTDEQDTTDEPIQFRR